MRLSNVVEHMCARGGQESLPLLHPHLHVGLSLIALRPDFISKNISAVVCIF